MVAMTDKAYAFRYRLEVSSKAVHIVDKSVSAMAKKNRKGWRLNGEMKRVRVRIRALCLPIHMFSYPRFN